MVAQEGNLPNELFEYERKQRHWTQRDVADRLGMFDVKTIQRWENGKADPDTFYTKQLEELFDKGIQQLGWSEEGSVPFMRIPRRNRYFMGREDIIQQLDELLPRTTHVVNTSTQTQLPSPCALTGLGGIGKSQIALEYAYRYMGKYQTIVQINARKPQTLISTYGSIATLVGLPERDLPEQEEIVAAVRAWLGQLSRWLLIFDSADDEVVVQEIADLLPARCRGHAIITTRLSSVGQEAEALAVGPMPTEEGADLLLRRAKIIKRMSTNESIPARARQQAEDLAQQLGGLPLALDQAGAYVEDKGVTLASYSRLYKDRLQQVKLRGRRGSYTGGYPDSVATTWSLSFDRIQKANPAAIELVRLLAFLHPQSIPEEVIAEGAPLLGPLLSPVAGDPDALNEAFGELLRHSIVSRDGETGTCSIHSLVQAVVRDGMDEETRRQWAERAVSAVNRVFPEVEFATWLRCQRYLSHAQACADLIEEYRLKTIEVSRLLHLTGCYLSERALYAAAEPLLIRALSVRIELLSSEHAEVAAILDALALLYYRRGEFRQGEQYAQMALAIWEPAHHPSTIRAFNDLANIYIDQGKYGEAEQLLQRAMEYGQEDETLSNLAEVYRAQGKFTQAESLNRQVLDIREQALGPEHPEVAKSLNNLGLVCYHLGQYSEAEHLYLRALGIWETALGPEHPEVASVCSNLGDVCYAQNRYTQSEEYFRRAMSIDEKLLGRDHVHVAEDLHNLAWLSQLQGKYNEAEGMYERALRIYEGALGLEHPLRAHSLHDMAKLRRSQGRYVEAEELLRQAISIYEHTLDEQHPYVAEGLGNLADLFLIQGRDAEAQPLFEQALSIREQALGPDHISMAVWLEKYARLLRETGRAERASAMEARAETIREKHAQENRE